MLAPTSKTKIYNKKYFPKFVKEPKFTLPVYKSVSYSDPLITYLNSVW